MASIEVNVIHMAANTKKRVLLPDDLPVRDLMPKIIKAMGGEPGAPGGSRLINKSQAFDYNEGDTLSSRGTKPDDMLGLVQEFQAGSSRRSSCHDDECLGLSLK